MEKQELLVLDDRSSDDGRAQNGAGWRLFTDGVMGGLSKGDLTFDIVHCIFCRNAPPKQGSFSTSQWICDVLADGYHPDTVCCE